MVTSGAYRVNYTNFITGFMNAMDLAFVSFSIFLKLRAALSRTSSVKIRTKVPPPLHVGYLGISTIFQLVCHAFVSITFVFSCYSRWVEARSCRSGRKRKNRKPHRISNIFRENRKPDAKNGKYANRNEHLNRETEVFWIKNGKIDIKNRQNRKTENSNVPLIHLRILRK